VIVSVGMSVDCCAIALLSCLIIGAAVAKEVSGG